MKTAKRIAIALSLVALGALLASIYFVPKIWEIRAEEYPLLKRPQLYLDIKIQSDKPIKKLMVECPKGIVVSEFTNLKSYDRILKNIPLGGEGTYQLCAVYDDGSTTCSGEMYVEGGYRVKNTVTSDSIKVDYQMY